MSNEAQGKNLLVGKAHSFPSTNKYLFLAAGSEGNIGKTCLVRPSSSACRVYKTYFNYKRMRNMELFFMSSKLLF